MSAPRATALQVAALAMLVHLLPRAFDRVLLVVQQVLHEHDELDLAALIDAIARAILRRAQKAELALPVAQHVRLETGELADLADREEFLNRDRDDWAHRSCSDRSSRAISSGTASARRRDPRRECVHHLHDRHVDAVRARRAPARSRVVITPSATVSLPASAASSDAPFPISMPSARLRLSAPVHVSTRSPTPASPANVAALRAERDAEPRHLVQPARDERRARVEAEPHAFDDARRDRHDVLERAAELDADDVVVRVDAKRASC